MSIIRVAIASENGVNVDTHFGQAKRYLVYEIDLEEKKYDKAEDLLVDIPKTSPASGCGCVGKDTVALESIGKQLSGISYILVEKIGPKPQKILMRYGVNSLETTLPIEAAIIKLIQFLAK